MTITGFEEYTQELTREEIDILIPLFMNAMEGRCAENPIKAPDLVRRINILLKINGYHEFKIVTEPKLRKCCNYVRSNSLLPLIATSKGYFVSNHFDVIQAQIKSLNERANSIRRCAAGLDKMLIKELL